MNQKQQKKYNKDKCRSESGNLINIRVFKKDYTLNPSACASENDEYLGTIFRDLVVTWWKYRAIKNTTMNFNDKKSTCKIGNFYILFASLLITILLFIIISRYHYYYHVKHK